LKLEPWIVVRFEAIPTTLDQLTPRFSPGFNGGAAAAGAMIEMGWYLFTAGKEKDRDRFAEG
jgi:hypothetical protein